jgi:hypothetical protein
MTYRKIATPETKMQYFSSVSALLAQTRESLCCRLQLPISFQVLSNALYALT